jgi:hypothetical protein
MSNCSLIIKDFGKGEDKIVEFPLSSREKAYILRFINFSDVSKKEVLRCIFDYWNRYTSWFDDSRLQKVWVNCKKKYGYKKLALGPKIPVNITIDWYTYYGFEQYAEKNKLSLEDVIHLAIEVWFNLENYLLIDKSLQEEWEACIDEEKLRANDAEAINDV